MAEHKPDEAQPAADVPAAAAPAIDRSVPGPPQTCTSFTYAPGGDAANEHFLCPVSHQPLFDPVQCKNGHCCCRGCLEKAGGVCPECRDASGAHVDAAVNIKAALDGLRVLCPDCRQEMARDRLPHHRNHECQLPCIRECGATVTRTGAAKHEAVCPLVPVTCDSAVFGCQWAGPRSQQATHAAACSLSGVLPALRLMSERIDAQAREIVSLQRDNAAQKKRIAAQDEHINKLETSLAAYTAPLQWHQLGDAFCEAKGVKLGNDWVPGGTTFRFANEAHGSVLLEGVIKGGKTDGEKALVVDGGCAFGEVTINPSGEVKVRVKDPKNDWLSFDGITFRTV